MISRLLPIAASQHAADFDRLLTSVHVHMAIQAVAWGAFLLLCLIRFRHRRHPRATRAGVHPVLPAIAIGAVIAGDAILLATAALPAWLTRATPPPSSTLEIRVIAEQFAWNIHYPGPDAVFGATRAALISASNPLGIDRTDARASDDIGILNVMTLPVGRPVVVHLTSRDVVHSFTLNEMRVKQDATPGVVARTWFTPTLTGQWQIACSQLCGLGHYRMRGEYSVVTESEWQRWLASELALLPRPWSTSGFPAARVRLSPDDRLDAASARARAMDLVAPTAPCLGGGNLGRDCRRGRQQSRPAARAAGSY